MKSLTKPEKFSDMSPCIYGYEIEDDCEPGSKWISKTHRQGKKQGTWMKCVATDCQPNPCTVGDVIIIWGEGK